MNACEEQLIASDLREVLGNKRAPDLVERTLQRLREPKAAPLKEEATVHTLPSWHWQRFALAASVLIAIGLIGWLAWPRPLPEGVSASASASYTVRADFIELREGALLLQTGAPEVRAGAARVNKINGRSVVNAGGIPTDFAALNELPLTEKEKPMLKEIKRWTVAAGVALCVLSGSALLNDKIVEAKDEAPAPEKIESPKPEDIKGLQAMLETTSSVTVRGLEKNRRKWCCPVEITNPIEVKELVDAVYSNLELADLPAGWKSDNQITFTLRDGRKIEAMVNIDAGLVDLRLAGWPRYSEYNVREDLLERFQRPIDRSVANGPDCPAPQGLRKLRGFSGADSKITKRELALVTDQAQFEALWIRHAPFKPLPEVDFTKEVVLGVFQGKGANSRGVYLVEILENQLSSPEEYVVRFDEDSYQTEGGSDSATAYGLFVLSRTDAMIHVEENVQGLLGQPALWQRYPLVEGGKLLRDRTAPATITRLRGWEGEGSGVKIARYALITDQAAFEALWKEHMPGDAVPEVEFDKEQVVAIFQSVLQGGGGVKITEMHANDARTVLHIGRTSYEHISGAVPKLTMAYGFHVYPKGMKLVLETPDYESKDAPPRWLETAWK